MTPRPPKEIVPHEPADERLDPTQPNLPPSREPDPDLPTTREEQDDPRF